ncbi:MAG: hypothetical protein ACJASR_002040 [Psychroserpens sp.]|jgi:hypothetical protein
MTVNDYYTTLNSETNRIFSETLSQGDAQGLAHDLVNTLQVWKSILIKYESSEMLSNSIEELDMSCLQMMQGTYRGSFASLRLSIEMLCGSIYYSAHNIEYKEWLNGSRDLTWSTLSCPDNGVLSKRFTDSYFPELANTSNDIHKQLKMLYRELSEMVHGNNKTWNYENPKLFFNEKLKDNYKSYIEKYSIMSNYVLCLRYLNSLTPDEVSKVETHINDSLGYIEAIRITIGGHHNG